MLSLEEPVGGRTKPGVTQGQPPLMLTGDIMLSPKGMLRQELRRLQEEREQNAVLLRHMAFEQRKVEQSRRRAQDTTQLDKSLQERVQLRNLKKECYYSSLAPFPEYIQTARDHHAETRILEYELPATARAANAASLRDRAHERVVERRDNERRIGEEKEFEITQKRLNLEPSVYGRQRIRAKQDTILAERRNNIAVHRNQRKNDLECQEELKDDEFRRKQEGREEIQESKRRLLTTMSTMKESKHQRLADQFSEQLKAVQEERARAREEGCAIKESMEAGQRQTHVRLQQDSLVLNRSVGHRKDVDAEVDMGRLSQMAPKATMLYQPSPPAAGGAGATTTLPRLVSPRRRPKH